MKSPFGHTYHAALCALLLAIGCRTSQEQVGDAPVKERNREVALQHFIEGSVCDQKGEYAKAILEYQDALRYDQDPAIYFAISKDYSILGKHALAAQMGLRAVTLDPSSRTYRENLAEIYVNAFEIDKAIGQYEAVVAMDSTYVEGWYNLARLYQMRKPLKAIEFYRSILDRFGPTWDVYAQLTALYTSLGRFEEAAQTIRDMLVMDPGNYELRKTLADAYLRAGKHEEALRMFNNLLERNPHDLEVRAAVAHVHLLRKEYELATDQLQSVLRSDSLSVETQLRFGQYFASFLQKDSTAAPYAYIVFEKIQQNHPADWRPYWFLGVIANVMKNDTAAARNLERVTQLSPTNVDGWVYRASIYMEKNEFTKSAEILEQARNFLPEEARVMFLLGISYHRLKRLDDAARELERAVQFSPKDVNMLSSLALVYDELKRHEDSDRLYEEALKIDPDNHIVLNNFGYSLTERGEQLERALAMAKEAVRQQPENSSYLDTIGWIYFRLGQFEEAERFIRKAVESGDASPVVLEHLGDVYSRLGQKEKAIEYWQKAFEQDSSNRKLQSKIFRGGL